MASIGLATIAKSVFSTLIPSKVKLGDGADTTPNVPVNNPERPDFYVRPDGEAVPGTGYRVVGGEANVNEVLKGTVAPRDPTYITFDDVRGLTPKKAQDLLQTPRAPTHVVDFDTKQILDDVRVPDGRWNTNGIPEPRTDTFPVYGNGGGTQAITSQPIKVDVGNVIKLVEE
jgi:hypothetical protein